MDLQTVIALGIVAAALVAGAAMFYRKSAAFHRKGNCGSDCGCGKK